MHGANRLGGNGVANSTVFGGIAGERMARGLRASRCAHPTRTRSPRSIAFHEAPLHRAPDVARADPRSALHMHVGRRRHRAQRGEPASRRRDARRARAQRWTRPAWPSADRAFNLSWHDWINLVEPDCGQPRDRGGGDWRARIRAARTTARIFRPPAISTRSTFTVARLDGGELTIGREPVRFTRVRPGESLLGRASGLTASHGQSPVSGSRRFGPFPAHRSRRTGAICNRIATKTRHPARFSS